MPRKVLIGLCSLALLALSAPIAPAAAARTWAGTWSTTSGGEMALDATGSGTYSFGRGTIRGGVNGDANRGTWNNGNGTTGTFKFTLEPDGLTFAGEGRYDDTGISANAFPWNGACVAGPCLENFADKCPAEGAGALFATAAEDDEQCGVFDVAKFRFRTSDGLPDKPDDKDLPESLLAIHLGGGAQIEKNLSGDGGKTANGLIQIKTTYTLAFDERAIELDVSGPAEYKKKGELRRVDFQGSVENGPTTDLNCDKAATFDGAFAVKGERANLRLSFSGGTGCLSSKPIVWRTRNLEKASIKPAKQQPRAR